MPRRRFLGLAGGAGVVVAAGLGVPLLLDRAPSTGELLRSRVPLPAPFQVPLPVPGVLQPTGRAADADRYDIVQREAVAEIIPGLPTRIWGYEGTFPGPTIESRSGRTAIVRHRNELRVPTVVHLRGGRTPPDSDGYPTDLVLPTGMDRTRVHGAHSEMHDPAAVVTRGARDYVYPLRQRAAMLW